MLNWLDNLTPSKTSVLTSVLAATLTNIGMYIRETYNASKAKKSEQRKLANALHAEVKTLFMLYEKNSLKPELPLQGSDIAIVRLSCNYLSIFENNTDKIGIFNPEDIACIIELYIGLKGLIDTILVLAERWDKYATYSRMHQSPTDLPERESRLIDVHGVYNIALIYQEHFFNNYKKVLNVLEQYK